jgi:hypothetical protein
LVLPIAVHMMDNKGKPNRKATIHALDWVVGFGHTPVNIDSGGGCSIVMRGYQPSNSMFGVLAC